MKNKKNLKRFRKMLMRNNDNAMKIKKKKRKKKLKKKMSKKS